MELKYVEYSEKIKNQANIIGANYFSLSIFNVCLRETIRVFKINFVVDGVVYDTIETSGNMTIILSDSPSKKWYVFDGWYLNNEWCF